MDANHYAKYKFQSSTSNDLAIQAAEVAANNNNSSLTNIYIFNFILTNFNHELEGRGFLTVENFVNWYLTKFYF